MLHVDTPQSRVRCGVARVDITPPVGIYHRMWGAAKHDRSTGVHRPLTATVLAIESLESVGKAHEELILVAVDHCLLWSKELNRLLDRLSAATHVDRGRIMIVFSHTHGAGLMGTERVELPGGELIPPYLDALTERLIVAVRQARSDRHNATIVYGTGRCSLARHRDLWDQATLQYVCGFNPAGPSDDTLLVAQVTADSGEPLATFVNYACHPTTLAWDNTLISPDFLGAMREVVERAQGVPCFFMQGASGDLGPRDGYVGDTAVADRNGRILGYAALAALEQLPPPLTRHEYLGPVISGATIGVWAHQPLAAESRQQLSRWQWRHFEVPLALRPEIPTLEFIDTETKRLAIVQDEALARNDETTARDARAQIERLTRWIVRLETLPSGGVFPFPVTMLRLGDVVWVLLESEHYQRLQITLRQRFAGLTIVIGTIINGSTHTYLCTRETYGLGVYQETVAIHAPGCLEELTLAIGDEIQRWMGE